jgi:type I restriction enzyme R subunit
MTVYFTESIVKDAALGWLEALGYQELHGPDIAAGEPGAERSAPNYRDVLLDRACERPSWSATARCTGC